jgi:hypothetical protein
MYEDRVSIDAELSKEYGKNANRPEKTIVKKRKNAKKSDNVPSEVTLVYGEEKMQEFARLKARYDSIVKADLSYERAKAYVGWGIDEDTPSARS